MKYIKLIIAIILLVFSNLSVILTIVIPKISINIGTWFFSNFNVNYQGYFSVIVVVLCLVIYFAFFEEKENYIINRLKLGLSFAFVVSLITNVLF